MKNILNVKKGDIIYILDTSFIHEVGTKFVEGIKAMSSEQIHLMCDTKGKEAIVEREPYKDTFTFYDKEESSIFIDVYIKDMDKHVSVDASYPTAQAMSKEEFESAMKHAQEIASDFSLDVYPEDYDDNE